MSAAKFRSRRFALVLIAVLAESIALLTTITPDNAAGLMAAYGAAVLGTITAYAFTRSEWAGGRGETP